MGTKWELHRLLLSVYSSVWLHRMDNNEDFYQESLNRFKVQFAEVRISPFCSWILLLLLTCSKISYFFSLFFAWQKRIFRCQISTNSYNLSKTKLLAHNCVEFWGKNVRILMCVLVALFNLCERVLSSWIVPFSSFGQIFVWDDSYLIRLLNEYHIKNSVLHFCVIHRYTLICI